MPAALSHERRAGQALLLLCLAAYAFVIPRGPQHNPDSRLALTYALVERGTVWVDGYAGETADRAVRGAHTYSDKAPGVSLWLAPIYAALRLIPLPDAHAPAPERFVTRYLLTFLGIGIPHAAFAVWLFHSLRRLEAAVTPRLAVMAGYALGTPAFLFSMHAFGHVPAAICLFAGASLMNSGSFRRTAAGGALLAGAAAFEYPAAVPALLLAGVNVVRTTPVEARLRGAAAFGVGAAPILLCLASYHAVAFGAPWLTGYAFVDPSGPFAGVHTTGTWGVGWPRADIALELLAGGRRGLLVVAPWLLLVLPGAVLAQGRSAADLYRAGLVFLPLLAVNAGYAVWDGGASWGPRHLVPALPFLVPLALPAVIRWPGIGYTLVAAAVGLSALAAASGTLPDAGAAVWDGFLRPALEHGNAGNSLGAVLGLTGWKGLVLLGCVAAVCWGWAAGARHGVGLAPAIGIALLAATRLDASSWEYAEGYYLYLGSRVAAGATLYREVASTQTPGVTLLAAGLWQLLPGPYVPRLFALSCYVVSAALAGALAVRLSRQAWAFPAAAAISALLPLGAGRPESFDANAVLAPISALYAVSITHGAHGWRAGLITAAGLGCKLTFAPLAIAALLVAPPQSWRAAAAAGVLCALSAVALFAWAGPQAFDALGGELESPMLPAGALLAVLQFVALEGAALPLAVAGLWLLRRERRLRRVHAVTIAALLLPLLAVHQGTFVSVARPAEPLIAAYAVAGALALARRIRLAESGVALGFLLVGALAPLRATVSAALPAAALGGAPLRWIRDQAPAGQPVVAPPYFAAVEQRVMLFDYADWTVLGIRAAAGVTPEREYAAALNQGLRSSSFPAVIADFRLAYVPGAQAALEAGYVRAASEGAGALEVSLWLPKGVPSMR